MPETITDLTIRTLLTLPAEFVPHEIVSLMRYPGHGNTRASRAYASRIHLEFRPLPARTQLSAAAASTVAHSARSGRTAPAPLVTTSALSATQWSQLMERVGALPTPTIAEQAQLGGDPRPEAPVGAPDRPQLEAQPPAPAGGAAPVSAPGGAAPVPAPGAAFAPPPGRPPKAVCR